MIKNIIDLTEIEPLLKKYFYSYKIGDPYEKVAVYIDDIIKGIISYSIIYDRAEINYIVTFPDYRRQGISQKLLIYTLGNIEKANCKSVSLEVDTLNMPAINLYLKHGFKKVTIRKNYYQGKDAFLMVKELEVRK